MVKSLYREDGKLDLVFIASGELNLNAMFAGALRRYIVENEMSIDSLARLIEVKTRAKEQRGVIDAIQGERLKEVDARDVKRIFSSLGLESKIYLPLAVRLENELKLPYPPFVKKLRAELRKEMKKQGYTNFSDKALREYMFGRILEGICGK